MSEVKRDVWSEVLPPGMRASPLVFITSWKIQKNNHDKMVKAVTGTIGNWGMDAQRMQPDKCFYSRTRHFFRPIEGTDQEEWFFMDEYDSVEAFEAMQKRMTSRFADAALSQEHKQRHQELLSLMLPNTTLAPVIYSEIESARIEFEPFKIRAAALARAHKS